MLGRRIMKQERSKSLSESNMEDMISQLPDSLICHILSHLSTEEAVSTSLLSTRWKNLWLWVPCLELNSRKFGDCNAFVCFGNMFFDSSRVSCIHKFILILGKNTTRIDDGSYFTSWIDAAIKRKIQHLEICWSKHVDLDKNPLRLYSCETLVSLKLQDVILDDAVFVVLPCLKKMYLDRNWYPTEATLERLISSCPVIENLEIAAANNDTKVYRVHSESLKSLNIERTSLLGGFKSATPEPGVVIDAPQLRCLTINDYVSKSFLVNKLESSAKLNVSLCFGGKHGVRIQFSSRRSGIHNFLPGILKVRDMKICPQTFQLICRYSEVEPLPKFCYMSRLCISLHAPSLYWLTTFLESCPNLNTLILEKFGSDIHQEEMTQVRVSSVPECLLSSLEFVDLKATISGLATQMNIVSFLLENSAVLKKLTLRLDHSTKDAILKTILEIPRGSIKCEVVIL